MIGVFQPFAAICSTIYGTACAASSLFTVTRTISEPARASAAICWTVLSISAVSVLVIDCTATGAPDPTITPPMLTLTDFLRAIEGIGLRSSLPLAAARPPYLPLIRRAMVVAMIRRRWWSVVVAMIIVLVRHWHVPVHNRGPAPAHRRHRGRCHQQSSPALQSSHRSLLESSP